jgi:hypothetical protein
MSDNEELEEGGEEEEVLLTKEEIQAQLDDINAPVKAIDQEPPEATVGVASSIEDVVSEAAEIAAGSSPAGGEARTLFSYHVVYSMFINQIENSVMDCIVRSGEPLGWNESTIGYMKEYIRRENGNRAGADFVHIIDWHALAPEDPEKSDEREEKLEASLPEESARVSPQQDQKSSPFNPDNT